MFGDAALEKRYSRVRKRAVLLVFGFTVLLSLPIEAAQSTISDVEDLRLDDGSALYVHNIALNSAQVGNLPENPWSGRLVDIGLATPEEMEGQSPVDAVRLRGKLGGGKAASVTVTQKRLAR